MLFYRLVPGRGLPIVFLNSLGTDLRIWDQVAARLDTDTPVLLIDKRGHGLSEDVSITMTRLVEDVADVMIQLNLAKALICGVSVGGMIAQGLAARRPELVSGLVLCNTAAKIGAASDWNARITTVDQSGLASVADAILERWFSARFRTREPVAVLGYRTMLEQTSVPGYVGVCAAIRDSDLTQTTRKLEVPTLCIAGSDDLATPPELVQALCDLIPNATIDVMQDVGHLPCIEAPEDVAAKLRQLHDVMS
ncbi:MAG: 3-oxoadipate enol-lactonase [Pseudomonadota bacterium]